MPAPVPVVEIPVSFRTVLIIPVTFDRVLGGGQDVAFYTIDVGVELRFPITINGVRNDLPAPPPTMELVVADVGTFPLAVSGADPTAAAYFVQAGDFQLGGVYSAMLRFTYDVDHVYNSNGFRLVVKEPFTAG